MKKFNLCIVAAFLLLNFVPSQVKAETKIATVSVSTSSSAATQANTYLARLDEINSMEKSALSPPQKKTLRKEVKDIKKRLFALNDGVYVSVGAIIIILLLLIILF